MTISLKQCTFNLDCWFISQAGQRLKAKHVPKPRIKYVAPPPRVAKDDDDDDNEDEESVKDRVVYEIKVKTARRAGAGTSAKVGKILESK